MVVLARLLDPEDFGLVAMVAVVTGIYGLFTSAGLSSATVQKATITDEQISTLFWINMLIGTILAFLCVATAPVLVAFYREPRLFWVTVAMAAGFLFNAAGVQHFALLQRQLRYVALTVIETLSQLVSVVGWNRHGYCGLWILGSCRSDNRLAGYQYRLYVADDGVDPGDAAPESWDRLYAAFWRHHHFERPGRLCCL